MAADRVFLEGYGWVDRALRRWWANCAAAVDAEIAELDRLEDSLTPLEEWARHVRGLIATLESCHHKAERHAEIIIDAIGRRGTTKGQGRRDPAAVDEREEQYRSLLAMLRSWCAGVEVNEDTPLFGRYGVRDLIELLGERTALKVWQVRRVIEKVERYADPGQRWVSVAEQVVDRAWQGQNAEFCGWTKAKVICDQVDGPAAEVSLAEAMDLLTGCNWDFVETVRTVLGAIGGDLHPARPLALHARNLQRNPARARLTVIADCLGAFCEGQLDRCAVDQEVVERLGERTPVARWLAGSLEKTLRLQLSL